MVAAYYNTIAYYLHKIQLITKIQNVYKLRNIQKLQTHKFIQQFKKMQNVQLQNIEINTGRYTTVGIVSVLGKEANNTY